MARIGVVTLLGTSAAVAAGVLAYLKLRHRKVPSWHDSLPLFKLRNALGMEVHVSVFGAAITKLLVPDAQGRKADVVLGYDTVQDYDVAEPCTYFGVVVGRVANRIAHAQFKLNEIDYKLLANNGANALHGGAKGLHKRVWDGRLISSDEYEAVQLQYTSPEGEEGYPGTLHVTVTYQLSRTANTLTTIITATADEATPVNIAQHSYFNLAGHASGSALGHRLRINGDHITPVSEALIPTGEYLPVAGTPFDFTTPHTIGERIAEVPGAAPGGYDHNYVLFGMGAQAAFIAKDGMASTKPKLAATLVDPVSRRAMDVLTTAPGLQFYSGNFLDGNCGKGGARYLKHAGLCLETQGFPNAINEPRFPSIVVQPQDMYRHEIVYRFYTAP